MSTLSRNAVLKNGLCALLAVSVFVLDLLIPLGVVVVVAYVGVVLFSVLLQQRHATMTVAIACTGLTLLGVSLSPPGGEPWKVLANRSLGVLTIWITAVVLIKRKEMHVALQESETRFQNMFLSSHDPILVLDPSNDRILDANPQGCELLKYSRDELLAIAMSDIHQADHAELRHFVQSVFDRGRGWTAELTCQDKHGQLIPVEISASTVNMNGQTCIVAAVRDITERREMQEAVQDTLHRFQGVLATAPEAIISVDQEQRIINFNQGACHIFGYTTEDVLGHSLSMLLPEAARIAHVQQVSTFAGTADVARQMGERSAIHGQRKSGEIFPAEASISKVLVGGEWIFTAILRDITERRQSEQRLAVEHAVARILATGTSLANVAPDILQSMCRLLGWRLGALWQLDCDAKLMRNFNLWKDDTADFSAFVDMTRTLTFANGDCLIGRVLTTRRPIWVRNVAKESDFPRAAVAERVGLHAAFAFPITIGGTIHGVMEFYSDRVQDSDEGLLRVAEVLGSQMGQFLERMRAEEALSYSQFAIDRAADSAFFIREDGRFFYVNEAACHTLGYTKDELYTMSVSDVSSGFTRDTWENHWRKMREGRMITFGGHHRAKDGTIFPVEVTTNHLEFRGTEYNCVFARDITERTQLEARLRQVQKMEAIGQLAGGIAHDFNNILTAIFGFSHLIERSLPKDSELQEDVAQVLTAAGRAKALVNQILAFSRQSEDEPKPMTIVPIIGEVVSLLRASLPTTIDLRLAVDPACGMIMADPTQIHQVVMNLCTNADHAMRGRDGRGVLDIDCHEVTLTASSQDRPAGRYVQLRIRDTGNGIRPEVLERIFEPFFTTKPVGEGTGMGLSVIHGIVTQCGGAITVESEVGEGTTFEVLFPVVVDKPRGGEEPSENESLGGTECILFVDDEPVLTKMYQRMLEHYGYTVVGRMSGTEALELFRHTPDRFDVVVTDQTMPHMTGAELAKEILQIRPEMPIILCTGYSATVSPELATAMGIRAHVMKPILSRDLTRIIRKICDQSCEE